jgi:hypothetical protein
MKRIGLALGLFLILLLTSCRIIYRDYQDDELEKLALNDFDFDRFEVFKIIDADTAQYLTGKSYQNSGVIIGIKDQNYQMIFIPKRISEAPYVLDSTMSFDLEEIYLVLEDYVENDLFIEDYGGLSLSVAPYNEFDESEQEAFDSQLFFIVTTDNQKFYCQYQDAHLVIYDIDFNLIHS